MTQPEPTNETTEAVSRAAVRGIAWLGLDRVLNQALAFGIFVFLGRLLEPRQFGIVAAANVLILFLKVLVNAGIPRALVQTASLEDEDADTAFWTSIIVSAALTIGTVLAAPLVARLFAEPQLTDVIRVLSLVFVLAAFESTQAALVDRAMAFRIQAIRRVYATVASSAIAVAFALGGAGVWALVAQILSYELVLVVLLWSMTTWRPGLRFSALDSVGSSVSASTTSAFGSSST